MSTSQLVQIAQHTQWAAPNVTGAKIAGLNIDQELYRLSLRTGPAEHAAVLEYLSRVVHIAKLPTHEQVPRLHDLESTLVSQPTIVKLLGEGGSAMADRCRRTQALLTSRSGRHGGGGATGGPTVAGPRRWRPWCPITCEACQPTHTTGGRSGSAGVSTASCFTR